MSEWGTDIYAAPEKFGLEIIWEGEDESLSYEFDKVVLWGSTSTGAVFLGHDNGCSCPSPFDTYTEPDSTNRLERIDVASFVTLRDKVRTAVLTEIEDWVGTKWGGITVAKAQQTASDAADAVASWTRARIVEVTA